MHDHIKQHIGERIRSARRMRGLTQEGLAAQIDRTPESVSCLERGKTAPKLETLNALARVLDLHLRDFFPPEGVVKTRRECRLRLEAEMKGHEILRKLTDKRLPVAVRQLEALLEE